jgi:colicin import membrane protein
MNAPTADRAAEVASEVVDRAEVVNGNAIVRYNRTAASLAELKARLSGAKYDLTTTAGDKAARAARQELVTLRSSLERKRAEFKAPALAFGKAIDSEAARLKAEILALEEPIDVQIRADEERREKERQAKAARIERLQAEIEAIRAQAAAGAFADSADEIRALLAACEATDVSEAVFAEFATPARLAKEQSAAALRQTLAKRIELDAEAARIAAERAELERLRAEAAAREKAERERVESEQAAERERLAAERRRLDEERAAERERERAAQLAIERQQAAARAEQERIDREAAAERARLDAEAAAARRAAEEAAAQARAEADRVAREAREADERKHAAELAALRRQQVEEAEAARRAQAERDAAAERARQAAPLMLSTLRTLQTSVAADSGDRVAIDKAISAATGEPVNSVGSYYAPDGTFMNADGTRSTFDDLDDGDDTGAAPAPVRAPRPKVAKAKASA